MTEKRATKSSKKKLIFVDSVGVNQRQSPRNRSKSKMYSTKGKFST